MWLAGSVSMTHNEGGGQGFHKVDGNVQDGCDQVASAPQPPQQQSQGPLVHWEQFLHVRSIKVMLVENDDCTRHIVTALLRNCNYEVIEAANGYQAWKILEDLSNHIDIVLTEVVMPSFSGLGLLCKIMSHKTRKNIPVIMMSSHDSMGLVFKCLSKGAVDFLVKPIRKNELKNLWQHVWRKCHSSSGSGSESGTRAQKSVNSKGNLRYDDSGNKVGDDNGSTGDGSDDGGGTQSSWTKQAIELESPEAASPCNQIAEHPDSTCGLVIRPIKTQATIDSNDGEGQSDNHGKGKEIAVEVPIKYNGNQNVKSKDTGLSDHSSNKHQAKDSKMPEPCMENAEIEGQREPKKIIDDCNEVIVGELSLKRPRANKLDGKEVHNGCNTLRHSELSAFTRYKTTSNAVKGTPGITASTSQPDNRSNIVKLESTRDDHSDGYLIYQGSNEQIIPRKTDHQELRIEHIHHHHHVHHYHNIDPEQPLSKHDLCLNNLAADASHCGSSNIIGRPVENNLENYSLNKSASGSKYGSNVNLEEKNIESDIGLAEKSGRGGDASGNGGGNRIDHRKSAQREAALTKFRQKREVRCFQKKVRYQNRKRLAEQRPRVRGQFVKGKSQ